MLHSSHGTAPPTFPAGVDDVRELGGEAAGVTVHLLQQAPAHPKRDRLQRAGASGGGAEATEQGWESGQAASIFRRSTVCAPRLNSITPAQHAPPPCQHYLYAVPPIHHRPQDVLDVVVVDAVALRGGGGAGTVEQVLVRIGIQQTAGYPLKNCELQTANCITWVSLVPCELSHLDDAHPPRHLEPLGVDVGAKGALRRHQRRQHDIGGVACSQPHAHPGKESCGSLRSGQAAADGRQQAAAALS